MHHVEPSEVAFISLLRFILNNMTALNVATATGPQGISAADFLITKIQDVRSMLSSLSLPKTIPVGNGDAGSYTNTELLAAVDYFMSNIHPWSACALCVFTTVTDPCVSSGSVASP